jgi:hypothetical protein
MTTTNTPPTNKTKISLREVAKMLLYHPSGYHFYENETGAYSHAKAILKDGLFKSSGVTSLELTNGKRITYEGGSCWVEDYSVKTPLDDTQPAHTPAVSSAAAASVEISEEALQAAERIQRIPGMRIEIYIREKWRNPLSSTDEELNLLTNKIAQQIQLAIDTAKEKNAAADVAAAHHTTAVKEQTPFKYEVGQWVRLKDARPYLWRIVKQKRTKQGKRYDLQNSNLVWSMAIEEKDIEAT